MLRWIPGFHFSNSIFYAAIFFGDFIRHLAFSRLSFEPDSDKHLTSLGVPVACNLTYESEKKLPGNIQSPVSSSFDDFM